MSKMSQLHAELTEQAAQLGFQSIEEAEANGFKVDYEKQELVPDVDKAYNDKKEEERKNREAKRVEMVWKILGDAKEAIALVFRPENKTYSRPADDITDKKINEYYHDLNRMCIELSDRNVMLWQKEDDEN